MRDKQNRVLFAGVVLLIAFALWTVLIRCVDVQAVGPEGTSVGFASFNAWFHRLTGVHWTLYTITDWLGFVPILICLCFACVGLFQAVKRRSLLRVDPDLLLLGVYYVLVIAAYLLFEMVPVNYRPVLVEGRLEASYPSSTTLLVLSVMPTLKLQIDRRSKKPAVRRIAAAFVYLFSAFMVVGRLISGVHWVTDIIGAVLLSAGLFMLYRSAVLLTDHKRAKIPGGNENGVS